MTTLKFWRALFSEACYSNNFISLLLGVQQQLLFDKRLQKYLLRDNICVLWWTTFKVETSCILRLLKPILRPLLFGVQQQLSFHKRLQNNLLWDNDCVLWRTTFKVETSLSSNILRLLKPISILLHPPRRGNSGPVFLFLPWKLQLLYLLDDPKIHISVSKLPFEPVTSWYIRANYSK